MKDLSAKQLEHSRLCRRVLDLDDQILFAGIVNERGRLVAGGLREGVEPLESEKDDEVLFMELALMVRMRREFDKQLGPVTFSMASRQNALTLSVVLQTDTLYVIAKPDTDYCTLPKKILAAAKRE